MPGFVLATACYLHPRSNVRDECWFLSICQQQGCGSIEACSGEKTLFHTIVPGQAGGGSFNIETLIAHRAEERLCL